MPASTLEQARRLVEQGQFRAARSTYKKLISQYPSDCGLLLECAVVEAESGQLKSSRRLFEKALKINPGDANIHFNLGEVALKAGAAHTAIRHFRQAAALAPDDADIHYGLGEALREQGDIEDSLKHLERAARLSPGDAEIQNALGIVRESVGNSTGAIEAYRKATSLAPRYRDAWCNLGLASMRAEMYEDADKAFEKTEELSGGETPTVILAPWAKVLLYMHRFEDSLKRVKQALEAGVDPSFAPLMRGQVQQQLGEFDAAETSFRETIALNPKLGSPYEKLARMRRLDADAAPALEKLLSDQEIPGDMRAPAGFALYSLLDRTGDTDAAFSALAAANRLKSEELPFRAAAHDAACDRAVATFDKDFFEARKGQGCMSTAPIFILGMPRSGTTLTEQILAAYPCVHAGGERQDIQDVAASVDDYPLGCRTLPETWAREQGERILARMLPEDSGARLATNKAPGNYAFIGFIAWLFPNAKIIYCKRDPLDTGLSSFEQNFRSGISYSYDQRAFAHVYRAHERLMRHWLEACPNPIHTVIYEDLVTKPEETARPMIEYCGLDWRAEALDTHKVQRPIDTASVWQVRQPINTESVGRWRRYEKHLGPMIEALAQS